MQLAQVLISDADAWAGQARQWLADLPARIWLIDGDLGAGKTTLVQAACHALGVQGPVASPTFGLANTYASPQGPIHHLDLYRLRSAEEALEAGLVEYLDGPDRCFVEWAERLPELWPSQYLHLHLTTTAGGQRLARLDLKHAHA